MILAKKLAKALVGVCILNFLVFALPAAQAHDAETPASASLTEGSGHGEASREAEICKLTDAALRAEIDLERFYLQYRLAGSAEPRWRRWRYFLAQSAGAGTFVASDNTNVVAFSRSLGHPVSNKVLRTSYATGLVGSVIGGGSDGFELCSNAGIALKNLACKSNPAQAVIEVKTKLKLIDTLLAEREKLLSACPDDQFWKISSQEGQVLRSYRNCCLHEFADIYAGIKSYQSGNNLYYAVDVAAYALYVIGYKLSLDGIAHPSTNGASAITGITGGCLFAENFALSTFVTKLLYKRNFKKLAQLLGERIFNASDEAERELAQLESRWQKSSAEKPAQQGHLPQRLAVYRLWSERFDEFLDKQTQQARRMSRVALQSQISGPLIAGAYIAQDTLAAVGFYHFRNNNRVSQRLAASGCISGAAGSGVSSLLTYQGFIEDLLYLHKLKKENARPEDLIHKRIDTLAELENMLEEKKQ